MRSRDGGRGDGEDRERERRGRRDDPLRIEGARRERDHRGRRCRGRRRAARRERIGDRDRRVGERDELRRAERGRIVAVATCSGHATTGDARPRDRASAIAGPAHVGTTAPDCASACTSSGAPSTSGAARYEGESAAAASAPAAANATAAGIDGCHASPRVSTAEAIAMGTAMPRSSSGAWWSSRAKSVALSA